MKINIGDFVKISTSVEIIEDYHPDVKGGQEIVKVSEDYIKIPTELTHKYINVIINNKHKRIPKNRVLYVYKKDKHPEMYL